jgi:hypothetical protein
MHTRIHADTHLRKLSHTTTYAIACTCGGVSRGGLRQCAHAAHAYSHNAHSAHAPNTRKHMRCMIAFLCSSHVRFALHTSHDRPRDRFPCTFVNAEGRGRSCAGIKCVGTFDFTFILTCCDLLVNTYIRGDSSQVKHDVCGCAGFQACRHASVRMTGFERECECARVRTCARMRLYCMCTCAV